MSLASACRHLPAAAEGGSAAPGMRVVVGIGELAVSANVSETIVTHALGSCIAVCIWDPVAHVAGLLHFLLPNAEINPTRAAAQPATFANTGIPLLFQAAYGLGLEKQRCKVRLVGGAEIGGVGGVGALNVGKRNLLAARNILWRNGVLIGAEAAGGTAPRTVMMRVSDGRIDILSGRDVVAEL